MIKTPERAFFHIIGFLFISFIGGYMKAYFKLILLSLVLSVCLVLCSCARVVTNNGDELIANSWQTKLDNGNIIKLSFDMDNATLALTYTNDTEVKLHGLCELSGTSFVIHDSDTFSTYKFDYLVHYDRVDITYGDATVSLNKIS